TAANGSTFNAQNTDIRQYSFMAGPQIRLFHTQRIQTSFRAMVGASYGYVPGPASGIANQTGFAGLVGSNGHVKIRRRIDMRFSPGLYLTRFGDDQTQKNLQFSIGPVFHFGGE